MNKSLIKEKSFQFALKIISFYRVLISENEFIISKQLLKSGTSIGANIEEALAGQTKKDFIAKMSISSKEARETKYWLRLLSESELTENDVSFLLDGIDEIIRMLTSIVKTSQKNLTKDLTLKT
ncbi:MAG: four helix bundle protein [Flavobacteriia bacterium]|nr:MAG: four helix bundle protein [Flavobacteriia bacterium]